MDRSFWAVFLTITIIGTIPWLAIFEHNYHPRIYRYSQKSEAQLGTVIGGGHRTAEPFG